MNSQPTTTTNTLAEPQPTGGQGIAPSPPQQAERETLLARLAEDALGVPSPLVASLQLNGGDLLQMAGVLREAVMTAAAQPGHDLERLRELLPLVETHLKLSRQADRVLRLQHELQHALSTAPRPKSHRNLSNNKILKAKNSKSVTQHE